MNSLKAECLKLKDTKLVALIVGLPLIYTFLFSAYAISTNRFSQTETMVVYMELFNFSMILVAAILISVMIEKENEAGSFSNLLRFSQRNKLFSAKLVLYVGLLSLAQFVATVSFVSTWALFGRMTGSWMLLWIKVSLLSNLANLCLIPLYVIVAYLVGLIGNVTLAILGVICSAILGGTDLGQGIWPWVPFTWSRISLTHVLTSSSLLALIGLFSLFLLVSGGILIGWFNQWQGQQINH